MIGEEWVESIVIWKRIRDFRFWLDELFGLGFGFGFGFVDYDIPRTPVHTLLLYKFPAFDWLSNFLQIFSFLFFRSSYSLNCDPRLGLNLGFIGSQLLSWEPSSYHFIWNWTIYMGTGQFQSLFASSSQYWSELGSSSWISKELGTLWGNWPVPAYFRQFQPV